MKGIIFDRGMIGIAIFGQTLVGKSPDFQKNLNFKNNSGVQSKNNVYHSVNKD
jgi:hypothetical protein